MHKQARVQTHQAKLYQDIYQDKRWKSTRSWKRHKNPLCEYCLPRAIVMDEVHHIIPWQWGRDDTEQETLAFDPNNVRSLCTKCHHHADNKLRKMHQDHRDNILNAYFNQ